MTTLPLDTGPLEVSLTLGDARHLSVTDIVALAEAADRLGLSGLWIAETWGRDAFAVLGMLARATTEVRLGTAVVNVYSRTPSQLAQAAATIDEMAGGRFVLGLGASSKAIVEGWHGQRFQQNTRRMEEVVAIVKLALSGEAVSHEGEIFHIHGPRLAGNRKAPNLRIGLAAETPSNVELARRVADYWLVPGAALLARPSAPHVHARTVALGRIYCVPESRDLRSLLKKEIAYYATNRGVHPQLDVEKLAALRNRGDWEGVVDSVPDTCLDEYATIGSEEECITALTRLAQHGANEVALFTPVGMTREDIVTSITRIARYLG